MTISDRVAAGETLVPIERITRFGRGLFEALGVPEADAHQLMDVLVWADLHGAPMLGVAKVPQYVARLRGGGTAPVARVTTIVERGGLTTIDAGDAFSHVVAPQAMRTAIERARIHGVGVSLVRNGTSSGTLGYYAMIAARDRMIGLAINNSPPLMPPTGGTGKVLGNQAFAIAVPAGRQAATLLDIATSAITQARIHEFRDSGRQLPPGVALDAAGQPTLDPVAALTGFLLPMAGHRGSGLAFMWELLTGVLAGGPRYGGNVTAPDVYDRPQGVSMFLLALDPTFLMPYDEFVARVDNVIDQVHAAAPAPGVRRVFVPGERGFEEAARREREGLALPAGLVERLQGFGRELGVEW